MPKEKLLRFEQQAVGLKVQASSLSTKSNWLTKNVQDIRHSDRDDSLVISRLAEEAVSYRLRAHDFMQQIQKDSIEYEHTRALGLRFTLDSLSLISKRDTLLVQFRSYRDSLRLVMDSLLTDSVFITKTLQQRRSQSKRNPLSDSLWWAISLDSAVATHPYRRQLQRLREVITLDSLEAIRFSRFARESDILSEGVQGKLTEQRRVLDSLNRSFRRLTTWKERLEGGTEKRVSVIVELEREIQSLNRHADSLVKVADSLQQISNDFKAIANRFFLPVRHYEDAVKFYGPPNIFSNVTFNLITRSANINGYTNFFGPIRFGASTILALEEAASDNTANNLNQFYGGGGNLVLHFSYPLLFNGSDYHGFTLQTMVKTSVSQIFTVPYYNIDLGLEAYGVISPVQWGRFFGYFRTGLAIGIRGFYEKIGYTNEIPFFYGQVVAGIEIWQVKLLISGIAFSPEGLGRAITLNNFTVQAPLPR